MCILSAIHLLWKKKVIIVILNYTRKVEGTLELLMWPITHLYNLKVNLFTLATPMSKYLISVVEYTRLWWCHVFNSIAKFYSITLIRPIFIIFDPNSIQPKILHPNPPQPKLLHLNPTQSKSLHLIRSIQVECESTNSFWKASMIDKRKIQHLFFIFRFKLSSKFESNRIDQKQIFYIFHCSQLKIISLFSFQVEFNCYELSLVNFKLGVTS